MNTRNQVIGVAALAVLIGAILSYFFLFKNFSAPHSSIATSTSLTIPDGSIASTTATSTGYTATPVYIPKDVVIPSYEKPLTFSPSISSDMRATMQMQFVQAGKVIRANPLSFDGWIALGNVRKEAGEYAEAVLDWQYMSAVYPRNVVSNANIADVYFHFLPDYPKAAAAYVLAIKNDPKQLYLYEDLFQLYTDAYPSAKAAVATSLKNGIISNPKAFELQEMLAKYYVKEGRLPEAKAEYGVAIANAQSQGNTAQATILQAELAAL